MDDVKSCYANFIVISFVPYLPGNGFILGQHFTLNYTVYNKSCDRWWLSTCVTYFSTLSHKRHDFQKENILNTIYKFFRYKVCLKHFSF